MYQDRYFRVNMDGNFKFSKNKINNCKYNIFTFLFQTIFGRFTNLYFICVAYSQVFREITPVDSVTTWIPILVIFIVTMIRELIDESKRYLEDRRINNRKYRIIRKEQERMIKFKDIKVGDIIILSENDQSPADLILIKIDGPFQTCSISTAYLDGDTYFKDVFPLTNTKDLTYDQILSLKGICTCNRPDPDLYKLSGNLNIMNPSQIEECKLTNKNLIQFGTSINNENDIYGIVCYTGKDTKLAMNSKKTPVKWTKLERFIDAISVSIFSLQLILTASFGTYANWFTEKHIKKCFYLRYDAYFAKEDGESDVWKYWLFNFLRFLSMTTSLIPISLKLTIDVCKFMHDLWISHDRNLLGKERGSSIQNQNLYNIINNNRNNEFVHEDIKPSVNNSSVIEDLGSIEYIFCDKTGTLTENLMTFKKLMVDGQIYGHSLDADSIIDDEKFKDEIRSKNEKVMLALYCIALCHSSRIKNLKMALKNSPEDKAFIKGLFDLGFFIVFDENFITLESQQYNIEKQRFELLKVVPFSYETKRISVIVKNHTNGKIYLLSQGSTDSINNNSTNSNSSLNSSYFAQVNQLASLGLRIIELAYRELNEDEVNNDIETLEEEAQMIGFAALEDKLREGVPETIENLRKAGIKLWMLTGDSFYTSCNVSYSSHLVGNDGPFILLSNDKERLGISTQGSNDRRPSKFSFHSNSNSNNNTDSNSKKHSTLEFESMNINNEIENDFDEENPFFIDMKYLLDQVEFYVDNQISALNGVFYLGVDGRYNELLSDEHKEQFIRIAMKAKSVVCSRASPNDKAEIVKCVNSKNCITLAIGDGGNDIPMLSIASVGVGIISKEERQTAAASDFCISEFRFLVRLLLIHGRYAMHRTSCLAQFCFYKSAIFFFIQFFYNFHNGFSVSSYFSDVNIISYNTLFTVLPVIFYIQDKDLCESSVLLHPFVYSDSQHSIFCNRRTIFWWYMRAFFQSVVLYFMSWLIFGKTYSSFIDGSSATLDEAQQVTFSAMIIIVFITIASESHHATILSLIFTWGDWILYILFSFYIDKSYKSYITRDSYLVMCRVMTDPFDWVAILSMVSVALFVPFIFTSFRIMLFPSRTESIHGYELKKQAAFEPEYLVSDDKGINDTVFLDEKYHPKTKWDKSHSISLPIALFCGCKKL